MQQIPSIENLYKEAQTLQGEMSALSHFIYAHPELGNQETESSAAHIDVLKKHGFTVEAPYLGLPTAFKAVYDTGRPGAAVAFLSEYDALPEIGHGCGHNLLGATDTFAGILTARHIDAIGGKVVVFGTPAEETDGAKVQMAEEGAFDGFDAAFASHPDDKWKASGTSMALEPIEFEFFGKTAHASETPDQGRNALDAAVSFYVSLGLLRQKMIPSARMHAIIAHGGTAPNVIPQYASVRMYIRSLSSAYVEELKGMVVAAAEAAAHAFGCTMQQHAFEIAFKEMVTNAPLSEAYNRNIRALGIDIDKEAPGSTGSIDMGDVSYVVPAIHPYYMITDGVRMAGHTAEFRDCSITPAAESEAVKNMAALSRTALEVMTDAELRTAMRTFFEQQ